MQPPPVGTESTSPTVAKFGPIANYLPPSGTIITYVFSAWGPVHDGGTKTTLNFASYNNTAGTLTLVVMSYNGSKVIKHVTFVFTFKVINGQSYIIKRVKTFQDETRSPQTSYFTPGVLMGLFSASPGTLTCQAKETGNVTPGTFSYTEKYLGTTTVVAGATTYTGCVISETSKFMPGDIVRMQWYWAPHKGPIMAGLAPVVSAKGLTVRLPWWCTIAKATATSIASATK